MGDKTKIDWCDASWNPITGCLHGCEYCYARRIAERFSAEGMERTFTGKGVNWYSDGPKELEYPVEVRGVKKPYPFGFAPTFHSYRLDIPKQWTKPRTIFVCSMADMFGEWVPDEWIEEVFEACKAAPQHRYLFLTKNPARYASLIINGILPTEKNFWYGSTTEKKCDTFWWSDYCNSFVSIEPIMEPFTNTGDDRCYVDWIIVGAETGSRKGKVVPEKAWIGEIVERARNLDIPVFMKESLRGIMGADFVQEYPWSDGA